MSKTTYKIVKNDLYGRYMVASRPIKQGELILKERPSFIGPQVHGPLICFRCCKNLLITGYNFCNECLKAPICSAKCTGSYHSANECNAMKTLNLKGEDFLKNSQIMSFLRTFLIKLYNPDVWNELMQLESHVEARKDTPIWRKYKFGIEDVLKELCLLSEDDLKEELVQKVCGILDVNTFEIRPPVLNVMTINQPDMQCLRGLYLKAALMAHDCMANAHLAVDNDFNLTIHAAVDIPEGQEIFFNYANVLQGNLERRLHLKEGKYFDCSCKRCSDHTEFGTNISALKCFRCRKGNILPIAATDLKSDWICRNCNKIIKNAVVNLTVLEGKMILEQTDFLDTRKVEKLLKRLLLTFHPNHYLILELKQNLIASLSASTPNKQQLLRKIELCKNLLEVLAVIEPGISRHTAITKYELTAAIIDLSHKMYRNKEISLDQLLEGLLEAEADLKAAVKYLLYEPINSPEGMMAQKALSDLKILRESLKDIRIDLINISGSKSLENKSKSKNKSKDNNLDKTDGNLKENKQKIKNQEKVEKPQNSKNIKEKDKIKQNKEKVISKDKVEECQDTIQKETKKKRNKKRK